MKFILKYKMIFRLLIFIWLGFSTIFMLHNKLQHEITYSHVDEVHTMIWGIDSMYTGKVETLRVGESTRWLARVIYPVAIYYLDGKMGGLTGINGWHYSGGDYINKHYKRTQSVKYDPNIQDFTFMMKFILGVLVILSFLLVSILLSNHYGFLAGILYFVLSMSTPLITEMFSIFYTESTLLIAMNLILFIGMLQKSNLLRMYVWLAFLFAFAVSTKLTGLVFILPIIAIILSKDNNIFKNMKIEGFIILIIIFYLLINIFAVSYVELFNQTLSNVWHLKTGSSHYTSTPGIDQLKQILNLLSYPLVFAFIIGFIYLIFQKIENKWIVLIMGLTSIIMIISLINVAFFYTRLFTTPQIILILIVSISLSIFIYSKKKYYIKTYLIPSIVLFLLGYHTNNIYKHTSLIHANIVLNSIQSCRQIATINIENGIIKNADILPDIPKKFALKKTINKFKKQFLPYDCIVIKRFKNNKQYTNYILPMNFKLKARYGDYFVYKK